MTGFEIGLLSVLAILVLIYSGMYVPVALGLVSFISVWLLRGSLEAPIYLLTLAASNSLEDYIFGVIPLFVLMGLLVSQAELGRDIYQVANAALRRLKGGLGVATVAANAAFAAITGVSIASAAVFTRVSVPEMLRFGYRPRFAVGVVAGSSVLGMLIPPSVMLIIYALITEQSVADLFTAGIVPGILLSLAYTVAIIAMAQFIPAYVGGQDSAKAAAAAAGMSAREATSKTVPIVVLVLLVLGGIYGGAVHADGGGCGGCCRGAGCRAGQAQAEPHDALAVLVETGHITASILMLIVAATMYSRMLALSGLPNDLGEWIAQAEIGLYGILAIYVVILILMGDDSGYDFHHPDYGAVVPADHRAVRGEPGVVRDRDDRGGGDRVVDAAAGDCMLCDQGDAGGRGSDLAVRYLCGGVSVCGDHVDRVDSVDCLSAS